MNGFFFPQININQGQVTQSDTLQAFMKLSMQNSQREQANFFAQLQTVFKIRSSNQPIFAFPRIQAPSDNTRVYINQPTGSYEAKMRQLESGGQYNITEKKHGNYLGAYQLGKAVLTDIGYMDKNGNWTGKDGIYSKEQFLKSPQIQEKAQKECMQKQWYYLDKLGATKLIGRTYTAENGQKITITKSSLLAGAHLSGPAGISTYLKKVVQWEENGGMGIRPKAPRDANGTSAETRMAIFQNYSTSNAVG